MSLLNQTFSLSDLPTLIVLVFVEIALSFDNALVLALIANRLPRRQRTKALSLGMVSGLILRAGMILAAAYLIHLFWIQIVGGSYLVYLGISRLHGIKKKKDLPAPSSNALPKIAKKPAPPLSLVKAIVFIEAADLIFALDSILAALALIGIAPFFASKLPSKLWIVYFGGAMGVIAMRFAARQLTKILDRFSKLEISAHLLVAWIGVKLGVEAILVYTLDLHLPFFCLVFFWIGVLGLVFFGLSGRNKRGF